MTAVPDATFLINSLVRIMDPWIIDLTIRLDGRVAVPGYIIRHELQRGEAGRAVSKLVDAEKICVLDVVGEGEVANFMKKYLKVHPGESHAILGSQRLGGARGGVHCILDDLEARKVASDLNIPYTGTIGKITDFWRKGLAGRGRVLDWLDRLQGSDFYAADELFDDARREVSGPRP